MKSFAEAKRLLEELSGESSSDVTELVRRERKANNRENNFQKMLVLENTPPATHQTPPQTMNVRDEIFLPVAASSQATPAVVITPNSETNFHREISPQVATARPPQENATSTNIPQICGNNVQTIQYVYQTVDEPVAVVGSNHQESNELIVHLQQIITRLNQLEKHVADISTQNEFILDSIRNFSSRMTSNEQPPSFHFNPIENELASMNNICFENNKVA
ncbi:uncharacterized protein LOC129780138 [Toxorhynchites rutilus septentrionalis]|uniref:uncharacterized protein LOC129780138 n=1 Tax=Toxorhynchites rutilus septentrionalis TaxID=329112 RepID=UPI002479D2AA|nr:uncharacterized protein LOC129780138 [Toxorhynchites rutilus septentrionalis]